MDIRDFLGKSFNFGLGLAVYSKEKIESIVDEMVNRGELAQKDARQVAEDLVKKGEEEREEIRKFIRSEVAAILKEAGFAPADQPSSEEKKQD